jgi:hypothetical protein
MKVYHQHVPKTAGKSIKIVLKRYGLGFSTNHHKPIWRTIGKKTGVFTFAVKRNPYDRAVSTYYHIKSHHSHFNKLFPAELNINDFYHALADNPKAWGKFPRRYKHFREQIKFLRKRDSFDISKKINLILRFEHLNEDWSQMVQTLGEINPAWKHAPKALDVHENKSIRKSWQEELDDKSITAINNYYSRDFEVLGYEKI